MRGLPRLRRDSGSPLVAAVTGRAKTGISPQRARRLGLASPQASDPKKANLAGGCLAELAARLWRCTHTAAGNQKDVHAVCNAGARTSGAALFHCHVLHHAAGLLRRPAAAALRNRSAWHAGRRSLCALAQALRTTRVAQFMEVSGSTIF